MGDKIGKDINHSPLSMHEYMLKLTHEVLQLHFKWRSQTQTVAFNCCLKTFFLWFEVSHMNRHGGQQLANHKNEAARISNGSEQDVI